MSTFNIGPVDRIEDLIPGLKPLPEPEQAPRGLEYIFNLRALETTGITVVASLDFNRVLVAFEPRSFMIIDHDTNVYVNPCGVPHPVTGMCTNYIPRFKTTLSGNGTHDDTVKLQRIILVVEEAIATGQSEEELAEAHKVLNLEPTGLISKYTLMEETIGDMIDAIDLVFHNDWEMTQSCIKDSKYLIEPKGTFLVPLVEDESNNWHNRGSFLSSYRSAREVADRIGIRVGPWGPPLKTVRKATKDQSRA